MIVDTSAVVAIAFAEPLAPRLTARIVDESACGIGAATLVESGLVLAARLGGDSRAFLRRFLDDLGVEVVPFLDAHWGVAVQAFRDFGKGRHPAALNLGDCFSYATARVAGRPLLCVGDDFPRTDLTLAKV